MMRTQTQIGWAPYGYGWHEKEFSSRLASCADGDSYETEYISENVQARYYTDGTCRLYKPYTDRRISSKFKFVDYRSRTDDTLTS